MGTFLLLVGFSCDEVERVISRVGQEGARAFDVPVLVSALALAGTITGCGDGGGTVKPDPDPLPSEPPFAGTIFIHPDIITESDPSSFVGLSDAGQGVRTVFDRRVSAWIQVDAYLFDATFDDGLATEVRVNPEFGSVDGARVEAVRYAEALGRIPTALRAEVRSVTIHRGVEPFGGGNENVLIHTGQGELYITDGILEETLVHEAVHTSLDGAHASAPGWREAQAADPTYVSTYARDFPNREDLAESFVPYLAVRLRSDRIPESLANTILAVMPNRIDYLDAQGFDLHPVN